MRCDGMGGMGWKRWDGRDVKGGMERKGWEWRNGKGGIGRERRNGTVEIGM